MNILHVWDSEYPWDVRAEKVSRCLTEAGHEVHMVARNRDDRVRLETLEEATVHRMRPWPLLGARFDHASQFPAFFNPRWIRLLATTALEQACEVIVVRDLPLSPTAWWVGRRLKVPVILDMAENYPAMIRAIWDHGRARMSDHLVRRPRSVEAVERWVIHRMEHIIVVVQESKERLVSLGVPPDRITVVHNTPSRERVNAMGRKTLGGRMPMRDELRLCYLGLMEAPRGIEVILDALRELVGREVAVHLDLIGDGRDMEIFREQAKRLRLLPDRVTFHGFVPYGDALEIVGRSDVGLVPHIANESWNSTIPNKLFDYMAAGLPVITSDAKPAARIVSQTGSGRVYTSTDPTSLADAVCDLRSFQNRVEAGTAGRNAVLKKFNWELDGARLVEAVEGVVSCP